MNELFKYAHVFGQIDIWIFLGEYFLLSLICMFNPLKNRHWQCNIIFFSFKTICFRIRNAAIFLTKEQIKPAIIKFNTKNQYLLNHWERDKKIVLMGVLTVSLEYTFDTKSSVFNTKKNLLNRIKVKKERKISRIHYLFIILIMFCLWMRLKWKMTWWKNDE